MQQVTIDQALQLAVQHQLAGRLPEAENICRQILAQQPNHSHALCLLGSIAQHAGRSDVAVELVRRAIAVAPNEAKYHLLLAMALQAMGQLDDAIAAFAKATQLAPGLIEAHFGLGVALYQRGRIDDAIAAHINTIKIRPELPEAHYNLACILHGQGRRDDAMICYSRAIQLNPNYAAAYNNMGNNLKETGKLDEAIAAYRRASQLQGDYVDAHVNLGIVLREQKKFDEAVAAGRTAVRINPRSVEAHFSLGCALFEQGKFEEAIASYSSVVQLNPNHVEAYNGLGNALKELKNNEQAIAAYRRAIELKADFAQAYSNLGNALKELGKFDEAIAALNQSIQLNPGLAATYYNLAGALWARPQAADKATSKHEEVIAAYKKAIELQSDFPDAWYNMGIAYYEQGMLDDAAPAYQEAGRLRPSFALAHLNFGNVRKDQGLLDEALAAYDRAIALEPGRADVHSNKVYVIHFHPGYDPKAIHEANREWNLRHAAPLKKLIQPHRNNRDPNRRLKIGYLSPDFGMHPIGRFMLPLMQCHNHNDFEIFCYADVRPPDALTNRLRNHADVWRNIIGLSDDQVANLVREDGIDILVDLAMHMTNHRLLVFARKPAPVQVTYLAYCSTTGVETIDYRLTDPYLDPPGQGDEFYCERSVHLPQTYWCYDPGMPTPDVGPLPAHANGQITFGCLNNFCKASPATLEAWCQLLKKTPTSRFILHASKGSHRQRLIDLLTHEGVDPSRLRFESHLPMDKYFELYNQIDIALDPFPWPGGTTTCDALWMGVPVISLTGQTAVSRAGMSLLSNVGLPDLVAHTQAEYVDLAANLAGDIHRLAALRAGLRDRMKQSVLMDAPRFAGGVEAAYREMWRRFTEGI